MGDVDDSACSGVLSGVNDKLEGDFNLFGDILAADFILTQAERTALLC